jgi:peptide/nickel transport system permease protein
VGRLARFARLAGAARIAAVIWLAALGVAAFANALLPLPDPLEIDLAVALSPPTADHPLGTDELGRDLLSRTLVAAEATLIVTAAATALNLTLGTLLGIAAGFFGGWIDAAVLFVIDLFWSVPFVVFAVLIVSVTGASTASLIVTIGLINWVTAARVVRAETSRLRDLDFVRTARAFGFSTRAVLLREIGPNLAPTVLALAAFTAIEVLTLETGLAFLGLSLPAPSPTWGGLLAEGLDYLTSAWWIVTFTALLITMTLAALQILSRGGAMASDAARSGGA